MAFRRRVSLGRARAGSSGDGGRVDAVSTPTAVVGAGSFGTCLAMVCARENDVKIWSRREDVAETINRERRNPRYLTEFDLPDRIEATVAAAVDAGLRCVQLREPSWSARDLARAARARRARRPRRGRRPSRSRRRRRGP